MPVVFNPVAGLFLIQAHSRYKPSKNHFFAWRAKKHEAARLRFMPRQQYFMILRIASYGESRASFSPPDDLARHSFSEGG